MLQQAFTGLEMATKPVGYDICYDELRQVALRLTQQQFSDLKGKCLLVETKKRSKFQNMFLRVLPALQEARREEEKKSISDVGFNPFNMEPGYTGLFPLDSFINLDQKGYRLNEKTGNMEFLTLQGLVRNPVEFLSNYAVVILGPPNTTGWGKTTFAKALARHYLVESTPRYKHSEAFCYVVSTVDALPKSIKGHQVVLLDEFRVADKEQLIYLSENGFKVLLDVKNEGSIRARTTDIQLGARVPRLMTSNASSAEDWCGGRFKWDMPQRRKCFVFVIDRPLIPGVKSQGSSAFHFGTWLCKRRP
jgi:hypothetical protein